MNYTIAIYGAPCSSQAPDTAYNFVQALLARGHGVYRLFFYMDGVQNASTLATPPQDEVNIPQRWAELIREHQLDAVVCVAAALRRGLLDEGEASRHEKPASNVTEPFTISGLGQLVEAGIESDRLITFGP